MNGLTDDLMFKAFVEKDSTFEGVFFTAVKTTGIFCRPICNARKPNRENVEFFPSTKEAILRGYRPCKLCKPMVNPSETPEYIHNIMEQLSADVSRRFKDWDLVQMGVDPATIRRWFLKNHGVTFHAYQRMVRINTAFKKIQKGNTITDTAFDSGFESISGFQDSFKSVFGVSPSQSKDIKIIDLTRIETPLGTMFACATEDGICLLEFSDRKMLETQFKSLAKRLNATIVQGDNPHFNILKIQLKEYFDGTRKDFTVPLFTPGTEFQQDVWKVLQAIPYGTTRSYIQQAITLNKKGAVRAVATANGMNRISILIPCHRVIGSDGQLTGYGGGVWRKQKLLDLEFVGTGLAPAPTINF